MGFLFAKCIFAAWIVIMFNVATPPYFPIEISRCIASNERATNMFFWGFIISAFVVAGGEMRHSTTTDAHKLVLYVLLFALFFIGYYDDVDHWFMHMLGVALLGATAVCAAYMQNRWFVLGLAAVLYGMRIVIKSVAVVMYESSAGVTVKQVADISFRIMYTGQCDAWQTKVAFQLGGVLQWASFAVLSVLY